MNFATLCNILQEEKHTEAGTATEGGGSWKCRVWEVGSSDPLSPPPFCNVPSPALVCVSWRVVDH